MFITKLQIVDGTVMFAIPKTIMDSLRLLSNTPVCLSISNGKLIIDTHPQYTLSQLLALCDADAPATADDHTWLNDDRVGREAI